MTVDLFSGDDDRVRLCVRVHREALKRSQHEPLFLVDVLTHVALRLVVGVRLVIGLDGLRGRWGRQDLSGGQTALVARGICRSVAIRFTAQSGELVCSWDPLESLSGCSTLASLRRRPRGVSIHEGVTIGLSITIGIAVGTVGEGDSSAIGSPAGMSIAVERHV